MKNPILNQTAVLIVDPQLDFFPGGALGVSGGNEIVDPINHLLEDFQSSLTFVSRDWHPANTKHFQDRGGIWVPHCVQGTSGAEFHPDLNLHRAHIVTKGDDPECDGGYSAFEGHLENIATPGKFFTLQEVLGQERIGHLIVAGLATDYCVKASVLDALKLGLTTMVFTPGIRAVNLSPEDGARALVEMKEAGAYLLS